MDRHPDDETPGSRAPGVDASRTDLDGAGNSFREMKTIAITSGAIGLLAAVVFLCVWRFGSHGEGAVWMASVKGAAEWVEAVPIPPVVGWGLLVVLCLFLARAKTKT